MIPSEGVHRFVVLLRVIRATPRMTERYSVCVSCQWRPDVQSELGGSVIVITEEEPGGEGSK